jgi:hypothetical protein
MGPTVPAMVTVSHGTTAGHIAQGFLGFSFEKTHMTNGTLAATNAPLIALFKLLGPGTLRIGAGDVDRATWLATAMPVTTMPFPLSVGTIEVDALADFLNATGWRVIYGVNYKSGTAMNSADEAKYAAGKLGKSLYAFEIGNEFDQLGTWATQRMKWESFATALRASVPNAPLAGPNDFQGPTFAAAFAHDEASLVTQLHHQHYRASGGTANCSVANLLSPDPTLAPLLQALQMAATSNHIVDGYRLAETNSCNHHGQAGVSDVLASALWGIDWMFDNALNGSSGVNFHGGEIGMDGTTPFIYSPIGEVNGAVTSARPLFYGMLLMARAGTGNVLATTASAGNVNFTAYAVAQADGSTNVVLVNKDPTSGVKASVDVGAAVSAASAITLQGPSPPSLTATTGLTLAGAAISSTGAWTPNPPYALPATGNIVTVVVPPASAAVVHAQ